MNRVMLSENQDPQQASATAQQEAQPTPTDLAPLTKIIEGAIKEHSPALDGWLFNGGTILTLVLTAGSSILASKVLGDWAWLAATLSALTGVIVAAERTLSFGERWRYHTNIQNSYRVLRARVVRAGTMREGTEKDEYVKTIWTSLESLLREPDIPGVAGTDQRQNGNPGQRGPTQR